jgi:hypothetical protein
MAASGAGAGAQRPDPDQAAVKLIAALKREASARPNVESMGGSNVVHSDSGAGCGLLRARAPARIGASGPERGVISRSADKGRGTVHA